MACLSRASPRHKRPGHRRQRPCLARPAAVVGPRPVSPCPRRRDADAGDATPADDHVINRSIFRQSLCVKELPVIYGEQAAAFMEFVSAEYEARDWTPG